MSARDRWALAHRHGQRDRGGVILSAGAHVLLLAGLVWAGSVGRPAAPTEPEVVELVFASALPQATPAENAAPPLTLAPAPVESASAQPADRADVDPPQLLPVTPPESLASTPPPPVTQATLPEIEPARLDPPTAAPVVAEAAELPIPLTAPVTLPAIVSLVRPPPAPPRPAPRRSAAHSAPPPVEASPAATAAAAPVLAQPAPVAAPLQRTAAIDPSWRGAVATWLAVHKHYPEAARQEGREGAVGVAFTLARDGRVLLVAIRHSSGVPVLDAAVHQMLDGQRLPPFPPEMQQGETEVGVTIRYALER